MISSSYECLDVATWSSRITNRGNIYYMIVEAWLQKVLSVLLNMHREIQVNSLLFGSFLVDGNSWIQRNFLQFCLPTPNS